MFVPKNLKNGFKFGFGSVVKYLTYFVFLQILPVFSGLEKKTGVNYRLGRRETAAFQRTRRRGGRKWVVGGHNFHSAQICAAR